MDGSAGRGASVDAAAIPVGIRDAAMPVETPGHGIQSAIRGAGVVFAAEHLVFPDRAGGADAGGGWAAHYLADPWGMVGDVVLRADFFAHGFAAGFSGVRIGRG